MVEYIVVNEELLGYRAPGSCHVGVLFAPGRGPLLSNTVVAMGYDVVRPATRADFDHYRVFLSDHIADDLKKPLAHPLVSYLKGNNDLLQGCWDINACVSALRERAEDFAWAAQCKSTNEVLAKADALELVLALDLNH